MDDLTDDEVLAFRDMAEFMANCAQAALGVYGSGGEVPRDRQASGRANLATWLRTHPTLREELQSYVQRIKDERERNAKLSKTRARR